MHNKAVEERLCTQPKSSPKGLLNFVVAFKQSFGEQASNDLQHMRVEFEVKIEPIPVSVVPKTEKKISMWRHISHQNSYPSAQPRNKVELRRASSDKSQINAAIFALIRRGLPEPSV